MKQTESKWAIGNWQSAIFLALALSLQPLALVASSSPFLIPYQGRLTNPQGVPYTNGQYTIAFTLYDQAVGGNVIWGPETHYKVGVINGMVNVFLGSINTLTNVDFSQTRHLGITIYADNNPNNPAPEMVPRQMIIPAFWAKNSEKLNGYDWSPIFGANNPTLPLPGTKIQNLSITAGQVAPQAITAAQIASNTITSGQLAGAVITSNQIVAGSISSFNLAPNSVLTTHIADGQVTLPKFAPKQVGTNVGVGGVAVSLGTGGSTYISSTTDVPVTNLTVTIVTTGRPVIAFLAPEEGADAYIGENGSMVGTSYCSLALYRGSTRVSSTFQGINFNPTASEYYSPNTFHFLDLTAPAGTNTYSVHFTSTTGFTFRFASVRLVAFEL